MSRRVKLGDAYRVPYNELCKHEVVIQPPEGKRALDIAKGLIDFGYHPPTIYFPLVVKEAMLIEPTETESKETLDDFIEAMLQLAETSEEDLQAAPVNAQTRRLDETRAARNLKARKRKCRNTRPVTRAVCPISTASSLKARAFSTRSNKVRAR